MTEEANAPLSQTALSETPRTNAEVDHPRNVDLDNGRAERLGKPTTDEVVPADFARTLERELAAEQTLRRQAVAERDEMLERLTAAMEDAERHRYIRALLPAEKMADTKYPYAEHDAGIVLTQPRSGEFERRPMTAAELAARDPALEIARDNYRHANYAGVCYYELWKIITKAIEGQLAALESEKALAVEAEREAIAALCDRENFPALAKLIRARSTPAGGEKG